MKLTITILVIACHMCYAQFGFLSSVGDIINSGADVVKQQVQKFFNTSVPGVEKLLDAEWNSFKDTFGKVYESAAEEAEHQLTFIKNKARIEEFNKQFKEGLQSFVQKINPFTDLTVEQFSEKLNGFNSSVSSSEHPIQAMEIQMAVPTKIPESVDWRKNGAVNPVRDQRLCGACWAFAAIGALEGQYFMKTGKLVELSVQHLIDCSEAYANHGCSGGNLVGAFTYVKDNNGISSEKSYPFKAHNAKCNTEIKDVPITSRGFVSIPQYDEKALEIAVATVGPVAAAIDANLASFQTYSGNVYNDSNCRQKPEQLSHGVLIVGYGVEPDGRKYWLGRNSYGLEWGIEGYFKIAKGQNQCGIATQASYPSL